MPLMAGSAPKDRTGRLARAWSLDRMTQTTTRNHVLAQGQQAERFGAIHSAHLRVRSIGRFAVR
jgi:hypothetical protein